jgi:DNA-binding IclR family transcriptional regulator
VSRSIRSVERALDVLSCFETEPQALSLTQIADQLNMSKSTVFRLLATLESKRFVQRDGDTGHYRLGSRLIHMGAVATQDWDVAQWAQPHMERLAEHYGETTDLAILDGTSVMYIQVVESPLRVRLSAAVGQRLPAFCTASGKAILAYLPFAQVMSLLNNGLQRFTSATRIELDDLARDLQETHTRGFAVSEQEYELDISAVAAPVLSAQQHPVFALAMAGPSFRLPRERLFELGAALRSTTETMALEMGSTALAAVSSKAAISGLAGRN